jgi:hypothetical protein
LTYRSHAALVQYALELFPGRTESRAPQ